MTLLDEALSEYDFRERHGVHVDAPPERVDEAVRAVTIGDMPLARVLFSLRRAPVRWRRHAGRAPIDVPLLGYALRSGFGWLGDEAGAEIVVGTIGQPWRLVGGESRRFERRDEFVTFEESGFVKAAMNFRLEPRGSGTLLTTETRVLATDSESRRRFRRYWLVIRPGSGLVRRSWLRAAKRRAERSTWDRKSARS